MGLWNVWDPKLKELGLVQDQDNVAKTMYDAAALRRAAQLRRFRRATRSRRITSATAS